MSAERKKTILRTIRITQELDDLLKVDAQESNLSVNALIDKIMMKYTEWDRHAKKFGFVSLSSETFRSILNEVDDSGAERLGLNLGGSVGKALTMFWFRKVNLENFLELISLYGKYTGDFTCQITQNGKGYMITLHHSLGRKWSVYLKNFISEFIRTVTGVLPQTDISDASIVISSHARPSGG
ncbi:MAG: hypothetical protein WED05_11375 [Candidatus Atabeyarchaeum deiterrae]